MVSQQTLNFGIEKHFLEVQVTKIGYFNIKMSKFAVIYKKKYFRHQKITKMMKSVHCQQTLQSFQLLNSTVTFFLQCIKLLILIGK